MSFDSAAKLFLSVQHKIFYIVMAFARFNLYVNSYTFLAKSYPSKVKARGGRWSWWSEIVGIIVFWIWYSAVLRGCGSWRTALAYLLVSHIVTSPLHVQVSMRLFRAETID